MRRADIGGAQDNRAGTVSYKVVYEKSRLPLGVWNSLLAKHPEILDKYLK